MSLTSWMESRRRPVEAALQECFSACWPDAFQPMLAYPIFTGGKRFRPLLCIAAAEALESPARVAIPSAVAIELVHTYSLVHDDLPAMDDDDERRGRPTVHRAYGEAAAILVGDALLTDAFRVLAEAPLPAETRLACVAKLAVASGHQGMVGGQAADLQLGGPITDLDALTRLHELKTGSLLRAAACMGGIAAQADAQTLAILDRVGANIGLAFQLTDDLLDADEDEGDDGPPSFVKFLGREETQRRAEALANTACDDASALPAPERLVGLARLAVERTH